MSSSRSCRPGSTCRSNSASWASRPWRSGVARLSMRTSRTCWPGDTERSSPTSGTRDTGRTQPARGTRRSDHPLWACWPWLPGCVPANLDLMGQAGSPVNREAHNATQWLNTDTNHTFDNDWFRRRGPPSGSTHHIGRAGGAAPLLRPGDPWNPGQDRCRECAAR